MTYKTVNINAFLILICAFALGSCNVSKYLADNEYLVKKNKIIIKDKQNSNDDENLASNLESLILQKPNSNYVFTPREYIYFRNKEEFEKEGQKKGRLKEAQRPVIFNDALMRQSAERMEKYLRNSKGFYFARVIPKATLSAKRATVEYTVITDARYTVRSKEYFIEDPELKKLIDKYEPRTLIKKGTKIDESIFENEKTRIFTKLQDKGYAAFAKNFIEFKADSSNMEMDIFVRIIPPQDGGYHQKYSIGKIKVYPNYRGTIDEDSPFQRTYQDVVYEFSSEDPYVKAPALARTIQFKEGQQYKKKNVDNTYSALSKLGTYRYINISSEISPESDSIIDFKIFLTPIEDKWAIDASLTLFYTYLGGSGSNISRLGVSGNTSLTNINTFGGAEKLTLSAETTSEVIIPQLNLNQTFSLKADLEFPRLIDPTGIYKSGMRTVLKMTEDQIINVDNKTTTDYYMSYGYVRQLGQYVTHSIIGTASYEWRPSKKFNYTFTPLNLNSLSTSVDSTFRSEYLDPSPLFARSFDKRFITSLGLVPMVSYQMVSPVFSSGFNWNIRANFEISGLEIFLLNKAYNVAFDNNDIWAIQLGQNNIFGFSRYVLGDVDVNATQIISGKHSISGRYHMGMAIPFLENDVIPFVKQFYVGGANSLRAWQTRELGPGGHKSTNQGNVAFFQSGDIVLEGSLEYRFPVWYLFEGALFLDAGNVWTLKYDAARPSTQFKFDQFYKQIAIGTGLGVRLNLDFLIIRLDMGYRVRNPYPSEDGKNSYWATPAWDFVEIRNYITNPNFAIGLNYPF